MGKFVSYQAPQVCDRGTEIRSRRSIDCRVESGKIVIELLKDDDLTLEELLAMPLEKEEEVDWGEAQGEEIW